MILNLLKTGLPKLYPLKIVAVLAFLIYGGLTAGVGNEPEKVTFVIFTRLVQINKLRMLETHL